MPQTITTGYKALVDAAEREIETMPARTRSSCRPRRTVLVDIRDIRELQRDGQGARRLPLPARHAGILDRSGRAPTTSRSSPQDKKFVFFCAGGLRSALAAQTAQRMGLKPVAHIEGGFGAWKKAGGPVEAPEAKSLRHSSRCWPHQRICLIGRLALRIVAMAATHGAETDHRQQELFVMVDAAMDRDEGRGHRL